eukprot:2196689-Prymnesium_polylepis.1
MAKLAMWDLSGQLDLLCSLMRSSRRPAPGNGWSSPLSQYFVTVPGEVVAAAEARTGLARVRGGVPLSVGAPGSAGAPGGPGR